MQRPNQGHADILQQSIAREGPSQHQGTKGEFHDQGDAEWIVIRRSLCGHNDTPCGRPAYQPPGVWPPGVWPPVG
jgi:hypothetical protein